MLIVRLFSPWLIVALGLLCSHGLRGQDQEATVDKTIADSWLSRLPTGIDPTSVIDLAVEEAWLEHKLSPAPAASDAAFARRVYLDLLGRIPRTDELDAFVNRVESRKREQLVDRLLESPEHAQHMAQVFDALLIGRDRGPGRGRRASTQWHDYLTDVFARNRPWDKVAREILLARPANKDSHAATWYLVSRNDKHQEMAEAVSKDFFGVRIDCAQCHDHPLAGEIEQRHYWGLVAYFNRSKNVDTPWGKGLGESAIGGFSEFANIEGQSQPNELVFLGDRRVEEARPGKDVKEEDKEELYHAAIDGQPRVPKFSRREQFVQRVLQDHPLLARAMVNRMWAWMMGRGIVHPVDALDSFHPPSHAGLLDWLGRDFADNGYDLRRLIRSLALSRAYQLSSSRADFVDPKWFTVGPTKPLTAEMLLASWLVVFDPEDAGQWQSNDTRDEIIRQFPDVLAEEPQASVGQGLLLTNGSTLNQLATPQHSRFLRQLCLQADDESCLVQLFNRCLGRNPDDAELESTRRFLKPRAGQRDQALSSIAWALVTSAEFRFNH